MRRTHSGMLALIARRRRAVAGCDGNRNTAPWRRDPRMPKPPPRSRHRAARERRRIAVVASRPRGHCPSRTTSRLAPAARVTVAARRSRRGRRARRAEGQTKGRVLARFRMDAVQTATASARRLKTQADLERQKNLLARRRGERARRRERRNGLPRRRGRRRRRVAPLPGRERARCHPGTVTVRSVQTDDRVGLAIPLFVVADARARVRGDRAERVRCAPCSAGAVSRST